MNGIQKAVGIGSAGLIAYSAFKDGTRRGLQKADSNIGSFTADYFVKQQSGNGSSVAEGLKSFHRKLVLDNNIYPVFSKVKNVFSSCTSELVKSSFYLACAGGATMFSNRIASTLCAIPLLFKGASIFTKEVLGVGKKSWLD